MVVTVGGGFVRVCRAMVLLGPGPGYHATVLTAAQGPHPASSGLSIQMLLPLLAQFLPMIIDRRTPDGQAPAPGAEQSGGLPDIGDLVGDVLGGGGLGSLLGGGR